MTDGRNILILLTATLLAWSGVAQADVAGTIRLHEQAGVRDRSVKLRDIAELTGEIDAHLPGMVVATIDPQAREATVELGQLRTKLTDAGVNWGRIGIRGYARCRVELIQPAPVVQQPDVPVIVNPQAKVELGGAITLRDKLALYLLEFTHLSRDEMVLNFSDADAATLRQSALGDRLEFEPTTSAVLGRIPVAIRRWRGEMLVDEVRVTAEVSRRTLVVTARETLRRGQTFAPSDVEVSEVVLSRDIGEPMSDLRQVVGQVARRAIRAGQPLYADDVQAPLLVRRGELLTVRSVAGGFVIRTVARAEEDGSKDDIITARNERSRESFFVRVSGRREGTVSNELPQSASAGELH